MVNLFIEKLRINAKMMELALTGHYLFKFYTVSMGCPSVIPSENMLDLSPKQTNLHLELASVPFQISTPPSQQLHS